MIPRHITTRCPHCHSVCKAVKTLQLAPTYREITFVCTNDECGYRFVAAVTPIRTLQAPMHPDPRVQIPLSAHVKAAEAA